QPRPAAGRRSDTTRPRATQAGFFALAKVVSTAPADAAKTFFDEAFSALAGPRRRRYKPAPQVGVWLSLVEHCVRDAGVAGSNPATPTIFLRDLSRPDQAPLGAPVSLSAPALPRRLVQPAADRLDGPLAQRPAAGQQFGRAGVMVGHQPSHEGARADLGQHLVHGRARRLPDDPGAGQIGAVLGGVGDAGERAGGAQPEIGRAHV